MLLLQAMFSASFPRGGVSAMMPSEDNPDGQIDEHLQRALIEICYAMAECSQGEASRQRLGAEAEMRERLVIIMASIEELLLIRLQAFKENDILRFGPPASVHN